MKVAEMEVDAKLWALTEVMTNNSVKAEEGLECSSVVEQMRASLLRKCRWKLGHAFPRPLLRRCEAIPATKRRGSKRTLETVTTENDRDSSVKRAKTDPYQSFSRERNKHKCPHCSVRFGSSVCLKRHSQRVHLDKMLLAQKAEATSDETFAKIVNDVFATMGSKNRCRVCGNGFRRKEVVVRHLIREHSESLRIELRRVQDEVNKFTTERDDKVNEVEQPVDRAEVARNEVPQSEQRSKFSSPTENKQFQVLPDPLAEEEKVNLVLPLGGDGEQEVKVVPGSLEVRTSHRRRIFRKVFPTSTAQCHIKVHVKTKQFKCAHCPFRFEKKESVTQHELRYHRSKIFESVKEPGLSEEQFARILNAVLARFIVGKRCVLCHLLNLVRCQRERHVMVSHAQRFCEVLKSYQQMLLRAPPELLESLIGKNIPPVIPPQPNANSAPDKVDTSLSGHPGDRFCKYCRLSFPTPSKQQSHAFRIHPVQALEKFREGTISSEDFEVGLAQVFRGLIRTEHSKSFWCLLCGKKFSARVYCQKHVVHEHTSRFSEDIKAYQQHPLSLALLSDHFEGVDESVLRDNGDKIESVPVPILVPKAESEVVDKRGSINHRTEDDPSIFGIKPKGLTWSMRTTETGIAKKYKCPHCHKRFGSAFILTRHSRTLHLDKVLIVHKTEATSEKAFARIVSAVFRSLSLKNKCRVCQRSYSRKESLVWHIFQQHSERLAEELRRHQEEPRRTTYEKYRIGSVEEGPSLQYSCKICGKGFWKKLNLKNHRRTHSLNKPFQCSYCDNAFRISMRKRLHEFRVHPERFLSDYRAVDTSPEKFRVALRQVFRKLLVPHDTPKCNVCQCCGRNFVNRKDGEYHVFQQHKDRFSNEIRSVQELSVSKVEVPKFQQVLHAESLKDSGGGYHHVSMRNIASKEVIPRSTLTLSSLQLEDPLAEENFLQKSPEPESPNEKEYPQMDAEPIAMCVPKTESSGLDEGGVTCTRNEGLVILGI